MTMLSHVVVGSNDMAKAKAFYEPVMAALGHEMKELPDNRIFFANGQGTFAVRTPLNGEAATFANGSTIGFTAATPEQVDAFHVAGLANGGSCEGQPGERPSPRGPGYYAAYLRDPDGNKLCVIAR
jgi:catechol 2,3-dioxygenase-like lactoylglutathione lyase family enzyme